MSLELALQENTAALNALREILLKGGVPAAPIGEAPPAETAKPKATKPKAEKTETEKVEAKKAEVAKVEEAKDEPLTYEATAAWLVKVGAKLGRKDGVDVILGKFGAQKNLKEVDPSRFAEVIVACQELLA